MFNVEVHNWDKFFRNRDMLMAGPRGSTISDTASSAMCKWSDFIKQGNGAWDIPVTITGSKLAIVDEKEGLPQLRKLTKEEAVK